MPLSVTGHGAAADLALDGRLGEPVLGAGQLLLELLGLLEQGVHVEAAAPRASKGLPGGVGHGVVLTSGWASLPRGWSGVRDLVDDLGAELAPEQLGGVEAVGVGVGVVGMGDVVGASVGAGRPGGADPD